MWNVFLLPWSLCLAVSLEPSVTQGSLCLLQGRSVGFDLHVAFGCVCAYSPCSLVHTHTPPGHAPGCMCVLCPGHLLSQFTPSALSSCNCLCMTFSRPQRTFSLSLFLFFSLRNEVISDSVSHQCWLTAYLCCCNWSGIAVVGHCVSLLRTDCFSLVVLGHSSLNSPITAAYLFHNSLIINAHHVTSWITCFRSS